MTVGIGRKDGQAHAAGRLLCAHRIFLIAPSDGGNATGIGELRRSRKLVHGPDEGRNAGARPITRPPERSDGIVAGDREPTWRKQDSGSIESCQNPGGVVRKPGAHVGRSDSFDRARVPGCKRPRSVRVRPASNQPGGACQEDRACAGEEEHQEPAGVRDDMLYASRRPRVSGTRLPRVCGRSAQLRRCPVRRDDRSSRRA